MKNYLVCVLAMDKLAYRTAAHQKQQASINGSDGAGGLVSPATTPSSALGLQVSVQRCIPKLKYYYLQTCIHIDLDSDYD